MAASLIYGRSFELIETVALRGGPAMALIPVDGGSTAISWSSVGEIEDAGEALGIPRDAWPFYRDIETELAVPLGDVEGRCAALRARFETIDPAATKAHDWLQHLRALLESGKSLFIIV
ncbi:MAG TPA: hypothetical protein VG755_21220 [Nannocystaceae bacterium]|nr:hypothetical protein [Nannocystaceae bacterium]